MAMLSISEMAERCGVSAVTLRRWDREGKLKPTVRTQGNHRRYEVAEAKTEKTTIVYARVSSHDQKADLVRQAECLQDHCKEQGWSEPLAITDLGSGLNFSKKGLLRMLALVCAGKVGRIVIQNRDRLLRFGAEMLIGIFRSLGVEVVLTEPQPTTDVENMVKDLCDIITVFSARMYGQRSGRNKRQKRDLALAVAQTLVC